MLAAPGIARDDDRRYAVSILDAILGGSASSRLFQEIREKRGMAYSVYTYGSQYTETGQVGIYVGTREDNLARVPRRDRRRARGRRGRQPPARRARPREGEPRGASAALAGEHVEPDDEARARARDRTWSSSRSRRRSAASGRVTEADVAAAASELFAPGAPVGRRDRAAGEPLPRRRRATEPGAGRAVVKVCLFGAQGKVGSVLGAGARAARATRSSTAALEGPEGCDVAVDFTRPTRSWRTSSGASPQRFPS